MAVTVSPYCGPQDLSIGASVMLPDTLDLAIEIQSVADHMDALLGYIYKLPLDGLQPNQILLLKSINSKMATGRVLLQLYGEGEGTALHAYGLRLLAEGDKLLMQLANGAVDLDALRVDSTALNAARGPSIKNSDFESGIDIFEAIVHRGEGGYWMPGQPRTLL